MKFSIITVAYNAEKTIEQTMNSILSQTYKNYEVIVKDGGSIDSTIKKVPIDNRVHLIRQNDKGIYDAMNQAIQVAKGEYLIFMNCGDIFADSEVLIKLEKFINENEGADIIYGNYLSNGFECFQPKTLTAFYLYRTPLCHQSMIIKRELFEKIGYYNLKYKILADYYFTQSAWWKKKKFKHVDLIICKYLGGGVSESKEGMIKKEFERKEILKEFYTYQQRFKYDFILFFSMRKIRIWLMSEKGPIGLQRIYKKISNCLNE